jgi:hypothetical protein
MIIAIWEGGVKPQRGNAFKEQPPLMKVVFARGPLD